MMPNLPHAVLFDMDGLTVDSEPEWLIAEEELALELGFTWEEADQAHCLGGPLRRVGEYLATRAGLPIEMGADLEQRIISMMVVRVTRGVRPMPGAIELIAELKEAGVPIALVSASPRRLVDAALLGSGLTGFDTTVAGDEVKRTKPFPDPYLEAARRLGVAASACVVLEDSATGVAAGLASGACVVAIPHLVPIVPAERLQVETSLHSISLGYLANCFNG
jgi:HAD superfamily hydrolase (TIGR01509 family)